MYRPTLMFYGYIEHDFKTITRGARLVAMRIKVRQEVRGSATLAVAAVLSLGGHAVAVAQQAGVNESQDGVAQFSSQAGLSKSQGIDTLAGVLEDGNSQPGVATAQASTSERAGEDDVRVEQAGGTVSQFPSADESSSDRDDDEDDPRSEFQAGVTASQKAAVAHKDEGHDGDEARGEDRETPVPDSQGSSSPQPAPQQQSPAPQREGPAPAPVPAPQREAPAPVPVPAPQREAPAPAPGPTIHLEQAPVVPQAPIAPQQMRIG